MQEAAAERVLVGVDGWALGAFAAYLLLILGIGVVSARFSSRGLSEFFVAGRRMHRFVVALSAVVSGRSAWLLLGVTGMAYTIGASALWAAAGYTIVEGLLFLFYAPRIRRFAGRYDCITLPDFFAARFDDEDGRLRLAIAAIFTAFLVAYVSAQFVGGGKAISASFGLSPGLGIALTAGFVLGYTILGGFLAVSLTDTLQGVLMLAALLGLPLLVALDMGGAGAVVAELRAFDPTALDPLALSAGALIGFLGIGLGSPGNPHIVIRYVSMDDPRQFRYAAAVGTAWNALMAVGAVAIGLLGRLYVPEVEALPAADPENLFPALAEAYLPGVLFGVVVAAIFAAIMSTADSQLLVMASTVVRDVYEQVWRKGEALAQDTLVLASRGVVAGLVVLALALGLLAEELVFWLVLFAWAGLGAAFGPTSILAVFWRGTTRPGVLAGMVAGAATAVAWYLTPALRAAIYELVPAFAVGTLVTVVVSRLTRRPEETEAMFRAMLEGEIAPETAPEAEAPTAPLRPPGVAG